MSLPLSLGPFSIGLLPWLLGVALAWLLARAWSARTERRTNVAAVDPTTSAESATTRAPSVGSVLTDMLFIGLLAARLAFVLPAWRSYRQAPLDLLLLGDGGLVAWVGIAAALAYAAWRLRAQARRRRVVLWSATAGAVLALVLTQVLSGLQRQAPPLPVTPFPRPSAPPLALMPGDGRPTVVNLWATWCPPCRRELPVFIQAQRDWPGIRFVFADQGEDAATVRAYLARSGLDANAVLLDEHSLLMQRYGSRALPTTLFFDADGRLVEAHLGPLSHATLERRLRTLAPAARR